MLNQIIIEGTITRIEPADGSAMFRFELSHRRDYKNAEGLPVIEVSTFEIKANERFSTYCDEWLKLGQLVRIVGRLMQECWSVDGKQMAKTLVVCEYIDFLKRSV